MAFDLRIEFSGLCVYLMHPDGVHTAVLMPDARLGRVNPRHEDNSLGKAHVGYLRFDMSNLTAGIPTGSADNGPAYEGVHRFGGETLDLGIPAGASPRTGTPQMPDFLRFAPKLNVQSGAVGRTPASPLVMRTLLRGGTFSSAGRQKDWRFSDVLNVGAPPYSGQFASVVKWIRRVELERLSLAFRPFDGSPPVQLHLTPLKDERGTPVIDLKISNLCAKNPLEWPELELDFVDGDDVDFKWLYRLYQANNTTVAQLLGGEPLPVPIQSQLETFGTQGCMGAVRFFEFDPVMF